MEMFIPDTSSEAIKSLQERLQEFEFYEGLISGTFDQATQDAVQRCQEVNGLAADGIVGLMTLHVLGLMELGLINI